MKKIKDHSDFDVLPKTKMSQANSEIGNFANESVLIKEIDSYFSSIKVFSLYMHIFNSFLSYSILLNI